MRITDRVFLVAAAALSLTACNSDLLGINGSVQGTYSLRTINGQFLPYTFNTGATVTSESLTLDSNGNYTDVVRYGTGQSSSYFGYYTQSGSSIQFTDQSSGLTYQGSLSGDQLTEQVGGYTQTYQRQ